MNFLKETGESKCNSPVKWDKYIEYGKQFFRIWYVVENLLLFNIPHLPGKSKQNFINKTAGISPMVQCMIGIRIAKMQFPALSLVADNSYGDIVPLPF